MLRLLVTSRTEEQRALLRACHSHFVSHGKRVTRFEMRRPADLVPAAEVASLRLGEVPDHAGRDASEVRRLHDLVAAPHRWSSLNWTAQDWRTYLAHPDRWHRFIEHGGVRIGWACCRRHAAREVEIESFGLIPKMVGRGLGGFALTLVARDAWAAIALGDCNAAGLLWLTTTSWDHPHAASNYRARGFLAVSQVSHRGS